MNQSQSEPQNDINGLSGKDYHKLEMIADSYQTTDDKTKSKLRTDTLNVRTLAGTGKLDNAVKGITCDHFMGYKQFRIHSCFRQIHVYCFRKNT